MTRNLRAAACAAALSFGPASFTYAQPLQSPVNVPEQRAQFARSAPATCPAPQDLPSALETIGYYSDAKASQVDEVKYAEEMKRELNLRANMDAIAQAVTAFVTAPAGQASVHGECVLTHLRKFASDQAMIGTTHFRGSGTVRLYASGPIFGYVILKGNFEIPAEDDRRIREWIRRLADQLLVYETTAPYGNNISYFAGAALALAAVALNEPPYLDSAVQIARGALAELNGDGLLPKELNRGDRSLEYSLFATQALALIGVVAQINGTDLFSGQHGLLRLMRTLAESLKNPQYFVRLTGEAKAIEPERIYRQNFGWLVVYRMLTADRSVDTVICSARPLFSFRVAGDWLVVFGNRSICDFPDKP